MVPQGVKEILKRNKLILKVYKRLMNRREEIKSSLFDKLYIDQEVKHNLVIFDDFLPDLLGSWRSAEMSSYLKHFDKSVMLCLKYFYDNPYSMFQHNKNFDEDKIKFIEKFDLSKENDIVIPIDRNLPININTKLAYCLFYKNLSDIFPVLEKFQIPFVFTLYPGGYFRLYDKECDIFLKKVKDSNLFKGVIVTQESVRNYLIKRLLFDEDKVNFIYGCPLELENYNTDFEKKCFGLNKQTLDICFVAAKYTPSGLDKGFDVFCEVASILTEKYDFIKFHVVGGFSEEDLLYPVNKDSISFYSYQYFDWFKEFYSAMDLILSPVRSHVLWQGAFDGFPTGGVMDAGLFGVAMMTSDPTGDNCFPQFVDLEDIFLIESNASNIVAKIEKVLQYPDSIVQVGLNGRQKLNLLFNKKDQMEQRIQLLQDCMISGS